MAYACPQVMMIQTPACRACIMDEKCTCLSCGLRDRLEKSLSCEVVGFIVHYVSDRSPLTCRNCGFADVREIHIYST